MRILLIHNKYKLRGGEDSVLESERSLLVSHGNEVELLYFDNSSIEGMLDKIKLSYQLIYNNHSRKTVEEAIERFKPEVIHVHNFFYIASPSIFYAAQKFKVPVVVTLHNYRLICSGSLLMRDAKPCENCINNSFPPDGILHGCHRGSAIETAQLTFTTGIHKVIGTWKHKVARYIALTDFAREKFLSSSLNLLPDQIVVKPNSVDDAGEGVFSEREDFFLFVGRLSAEKGVDVLLNAFLNKAIRLEIIGDGPLLEQVNEFVKRSSNITYSGQKPKSYVAERMKKCRAVVVPSICYESLPTAVLEAFSTGTPVIISDIGNLNTIITDCFNGFHFKLNDPLDLYDKVVRFSENLSSNKSLYTNARITYLEKYTHEINYNSLMKVYDSARSSMV